LTQPASLLTLIQVLVLLFSKGDLYYVRLIRVIGKVKVTM
jgi:hypothetical protein